MPLISEVVEAMQSAQDRGFKVLAFVVPVAPDALHASGLAAATIEDRVQQAMIAELEACISVDHLERTDEERTLPLWSISEEDLGIIITQLRKSLPPRYQTQFLSSSERKRKEVMERLGVQLAARQEGLV